MSKFIICPKCNSLMIISNNEGIHWTCIYCGYENHEELRIVGTDDGVDHREYAERLDFHILDNWIGE